ncbi:hypothetical protein E3T55_00155 [Cryobacterium frigoriphilum]|uniref:AbiEi antitoxin C-terminal domain-containing protein n=1 Tax=Cryobacterium frigoriphilum TaxID=1259150 RepID=A0A4R9ABZ7_9MICO|nr:hypothetical protein [Cryobacterium frigoriphilum]TFD56094.1 hypothetical protein E3T55_00155 [Cryobacterium frigoriphilum]
MRPLDTELLTQSLILAADIHGALGTDLRLRRIAQKGELFRVGRGTYCNTTRWNGFTENEQYAARVIGVALARTAPPPLSHESAAALWGLSLFGPWPDEVHFVVERAAGGRSAPGVRRHAIGIDARDITMRGSVLVTSAARTAVDLAAVLDLKSAVAVVDQVLHADRAGHPPLATKDELIDVWQRMLPFRGSVRARAIIDFAVTQSESLLESGSRVNMALSGFPRPELQHHFVVDGADVFTDFFWPQADAVGEADGKGKYTDPALMRGRTPQEVHYAEKQREDGVRRQVRAFTRWDFGTGMSQHRLRARLLMLGLEPGHPWLVK